MNSKDLNAMKNAQGYEYAVQLTRFLLFPVGLWPSKSVLYKRYIRPLAILLCLGFMLFGLIPKFIYTAYFARDIGMYIQLAGPVSLGVMTLSKYIMMLNRQHDVASCFLFMTNDWQKLTSLTDRKIMLSNAKIGRWLIMICVFFMIFGGMAYITIIPLRKAPVVRENVTLRPLAYPAHFIFFNPRVRPIWDYVFAAQIICGLFKYTVNCGINSIAIICVMHISSQIKITSLMFDRLVDNFDNILLGKIVTEHLRFLKFASSLEYFLNQIFLVEVLGNTCIICIVGFCLIMEYERSETVASITFSLLLCSFLFNIFILCYIGEILTEQCESIGNTAYMIHWYHLSRKDAQNIVFIIASTQGPVVLTAGKMMNLSLQSFTNVIKAAASYLNLLRTMTANAS